MSKLITETDLAAKDVVEDLTLSPTGPPDKIGIFISGIRTNAEWVEDTTLHVQRFSKPIKYFKTSCGGLSSLHLISRLGLGSKRIGLRNQITNIIVANPHAKISLICHSIGTDLIVDIINDIDYSFENIFFLGSICNRKHSLSISRRCSRFVNHRGLLDPWPVFASLHPKYGYTGTFGFSDPYTQDYRFMNNHNSCVSVEHIDNFIAPLIIGYSPLYPTQITEVYDFNAIFYARRIMLASLMLGALGAMFSLFTLLLPFIGITSILYAWYHGKNLPWSRKKFVG